MIISLRMAAAGRRSRRPAAPRRDDRPNHANAVRTHQQARGPKSARKAVTYPEEGRRRQLPPPPLLCGGEWRDYKRDYANRKGQWYLPNAANARRTWPANHKLTAAITPMSVTTSVFAPGTVTAQPTANRRTASASRFTKKTIPTPRVTARTSFQIARRHRCTLKRGVSELPRRRKVSISSSSTCPADMAPQTSSQW